MNNHLCVYLTCLPHFQSGPRTTLEPTPSTVLVPFRDERVTFVGPLEAIHNIETKGHLQKNFFLTIVYTDKFLYNK